jgi:hypothetical protein
MLWKAPGSAVAEMESAIIARVTAIQFNNHPIIH